MASDRAELAAARVAAAARRAEQLRERVERLRAGVPPTWEDVVRARAWAEAQREESVKAEERFLRTFAAGVDLLEASSPPPGPNARLRGGSARPSSRAASQEARRFETGPRPPHPPTPPPEDRAVSERLSSENRVLRSALTAIASSSDSGGTHWSRDRRRRLWASLVEQCGEESWPGWARALCLAATTMLPGIRGVAVSGYDAERVPHLLAATDEWTRRAEEVHQLAGEGPAIDAYTSRAPVVVQGLEDAGARWPGYAAAAAAVGVGGLQARPIILDRARFGTITLYPGEGSGVDREQASDGAFLAAAASQALLADLDVLEQGPYPWDPGTERIQMAAGMLSSQLDVTVEQAHALLRAAAFSRTRGLADVAEAVLDGSLELG